LISSHSVAMRAPRLAARFAATWSITRRDQRFVALHVHHDLPGARPSAATVSAAGRAGLVVGAGEAKPRRAKPAATARMRSSSVAITTRAALLRHARPDGGGSVGCPAMSSRRLPGSRVEAKRAG